MKKRIIVGLIVGMLFVLTACSNSGGSNNASGSETSSETETEEAENTGTTGSEEDTSSDSENEKVLYGSEAGITIDTPQTYLDNKERLFLYYDGVEAEEGLYIFEAYLYPASYDELEKMSDEEYEKAEAQTLNVINILKVKAEDWSFEDVEKWCDWFIGLEKGKLQEAGTIEDEAGNKYNCYVHVASPDDIASDMDEETRKIYEGIISELNVAKDNIKYSEPVDYASLYIGQTISFTSTDVDGNEVTSEELFGKSDITMVNFWASWCGPCVQEMPELEKMNKEFQAKGGQIIGVLTDGSDEIGLADGKDVIDSTGVTYTNVINWPEMNSQVKLQYFPTTFFVDSKGTILGDAVIGANLDGYREKMEELLG